MPLTVSYCQPHNTKWLNIFHTKNCLLTKIHIRTVICIFPIAKHSLTNIYYVILFIWIELIFSRYHVYSSDMSATVSYCQPHNNDERLYYMSYKILLHTRYYVSKRWLFTLSIWLKLNLPVSAQVVDIPHPEFPSVLHVSPIPL